MQSSPTPDTEDDAALTPDKSRFKFQKLLQPFTIERGIAAYTEFLKAEKLSAATKP